jgi:hypothetical protein
LAQESSEAEVPPSWKGLLLNERLKVDGVTTIRIWKKLIVNKVLKLSYCRFEWLLSFSECKSRFSLKSINLPFKLNGSQLVSRQPCEWNRPFFETLEKIVKDSAK